MKTFRNKYILSLLIGSFILSSCEKEIHLDVKPSEPRIVIEAVMAADSLAKVSITKTKNYNEDNVYPPVRGAIVSIWDNEGNKETLEEQADGKYMSRTIRGTQGRTYNLMVEVEGETFSSVSTMPYEVLIDSLFMYHIPAMDAAYPQVRIKDPKGIENYYRGILYINGKRMPDIFVIDDEDKDGKYIYAPLLFDSNYNDDKEIEKGDHILIEMHCLGKGAYKFFETLADITWSTANPTSNIEGGALGYFSTHTIDRKEISADW